MSKIIELLKQAQALQIKQIAEGEWCDLETVLTDDGFGIKGFKVYGGNLEPVEFFLGEY